MRRRAIAWFTRKNFGGHRALDPTGLPPTFDEWHSRAGQFLAEAPPSARVVIDPVKFAAWCRVQGCEADATARAAFAQVVAEASRSRGWWVRRS
jgi:hypothetical protein